MAVAAFIVAAVISLGTSWVFVIRLERLGERMGFSEALLGLLAAVAADTPEITSAVTALVHHQQAVGSGVVLGSNVFNLAALLGVGAVVAGGIALHRRVVVLGGAVALAVALISVLCVVGVIGPALGLALVLVVFMPYVVLSATRPTSVARRWMSRSMTWLATAVAEEEDELAQAIRPRRGTRRDAVVAVAALVVIVSSSVAMERAASSLGRGHQVAGIIVGALILAAVTSLPNAVAGVYLAARGRGAALLSTALNSNAFNVILGLLLPATVVGLAKSDGGQNLIVGCYGALTVITVAFAYQARGLRRWQGWFVIGGYLGFVAALLAIS